MALVDSADVGKAKAELLDALAQVGQRSLGKVDVLSEHHVRDDPAEHGVAEKFEALVAVVIVRLGHP